ncbi:hypothetical protein USB125703_00918 [Pseudoclavibacter triregionum]|nr:hypothetical protein USB125703_00918 [Pseudoclavibacter triregionum]
MRDNRAMVFFQPTGAPRRDLVRDVGEELAVFGVGGRIRETGPAPLRSVSDEQADAGEIALEPRPGGRFQRAVRPETRSAYRPMIFADDEAEARFDPGAAASASGVQASALQMPALPLAPAEPIGVWRLRREFPHELRVLADSNDRPAWLQHRSRGVTATDAAKLATEASVKQVVRDKVRGSGFTGNAYTDFGRAREPHIAAWVAERHGIEPCGLLFHAESSRAHLATPDGLYCDEEGRVTLAEIKTTNKPWSRIPRTYLRQVWWQQYVLGAERTLFVWERHRDFVVVDEEPRFVWIERDDEEIERMARLADAVLEQVEELRAQLEPPY